MLTALYAHAWVDMEKRLIKESPPPEPVVKDDSPVKIAQALAAQSANSLLIAQITSAVEQKMSGQIDAFAATLQTIVDKFTTSRETDVEITERDEYGRVQRLKVRSSKSTVH